MTGTAIPAATLCATAADILRKVGVPAGHAEAVASALVDADLEGLGSHGLMLLPMYVERIVAGSVSPQAEGEVVSSTDGAIVMDACNGLGQVTSRRAVDLAMDAARGNGFGVVAVRNAFHFGAAGRWASQIAQGGAVGIVMCNTRPLMPAPGGAERVVGNNPLAVALPADGEPLLLDLALSEAAMGKIRLAADAGRPIPAGWATDGDGVPTTDAAAAIAGMLLPAGGPKGFGLAVIIDLLAGGLSSGAVGEDVRPLYGDRSLPYACSHLFMAIDVGRFRPAGDFAAEVTGFADRIRRSRPAPGTAAVMAPGDPARKARASSNGFCRLSPATLKALAELARAHDIMFPSMA